MVLRISQPFLEQYRIIFFQRNLFQEHVTKQYRLDHVREILFVYELFLSPTVRKLFLFAVSFAVSMQYCTERISFPSQNYIRRCLSARDIELRNFAISENLTNCSGDIAWKRWYSMHNITRHMAVSRGDSASSWWAWKYPRFLVQYRLRSSLSRVKSWLNFPGWAGMAAGRRILRAWIKKNWSEFKGNSRGLV